MIARPIARSIARSIAGSVTGSNWTPSNLFESADGFYSTVDSSHLYQDSAGTIPVVTDSDPVLLSINSVDTAVGDAVVNGSLAGAVFRENHFGSGLHGLEFIESATTAENSSLAIANSGSVYGAGYLFCAVLDLTGVASGFARILNTTFDAFALYYESDAQLWLKSADSGSQRPEVTGAVSLPQPSLLTVRVRPTGKEIRINGLLASDNASAPGASAGNPMCLGWGGSGALGTAPMVMGSHLFAGGEISNTDMERVERFFMARYSLPNLGTIDTSALRVVAHRGDSDNAPENTIPAYSTADITDPDKFDGWVECDVQKTSDGELILMHDLTVDRTTDGTGSVADLTLAQIKALDAGSWFGAEFTGTRVPTLDEFLTHCQANNLKAYVETKGPLINSADIQAILNLVDATIGRPNFVLQSFSTSHLDWLRALDTNIEVGYLNATLNETTLATAASFGNAFLFTSIGQITQDNMGLANSMGVTVDAFTLSTYPQVAFCAAFGVRGITSNRFIEPYTATIS